jgi:hypothetical protein
VDNGCERVIAIQLITFYPALIEGIRRGRKKMLSKEDGLERHWHKFFNQ